MNFCENCGNKLEPNDKFCTKCGSNLGKTPMPVQNTEKVYTVEDEKKANKLGITSLCLFFGPGIVSALLIAISASVKSSIIMSLATILSALSGVASLASIVLMIIIRVKYPKNKLGKILMWLYIILFVLAIVLTVLVFVACLAFCGNELSNCHGTF